MIPCFSLVAGPAAKPGCRRLPPRYALSGFRTIP